MRSTLILILILLACLPAFASKRPNIIIIYADDVGDWKYVPPGIVTSKGSIDEKIVEAIGEEGCALLPA